ncbi:1-acyl-sn-glycerol-3-phosphate acyltransferase [Williamsia deligens]|uniref:1-acyl-sn-glycerol-3-phosphate acyltransferase n=1 Tax=Williamsia deligens TaxID=321325 RepID=A0ABW3GBD4_9NOCA|nr:1-acyl-sn-glycerol-3-phosphate acyltransferase [Williamsia deligens]MCP2196015.1 Acyltransferase [Williamsia deligens]
MDELPRRIVGLTVAIARLYHRMESHLPDEMPDGPVLFVANHGFGGVFDLNVLAFASVYDHLGDRRRVTILTHQIAWTLKLGRVAEKFDATPANHHAAVDALAAESHVLVFPGGDIDGFKKWSDRNKVLFAGRTGFARVAMDAGVPIVPVVTAGAGESLLVLNQGTRLARLTRLDKLLRMKSVPTSLSVPWGLNVGLVGLLPYVPLPSKIVTTVLPAMRPHDDESVDTFAARVHRAMDDELETMTRSRTPLLG